MLPVDFAEYPFLRKQKVQKMRKISITPVVYIGIILKYVSGICMEIETFMVLL